MYNDLKRYLFLMTLQDLIIFPDDCEFKYVTQCTTGRVYVLKFKSSNKKSFFWLQVKKILNYLNYNSNLFPFKGSQN